MRLKTAVVLCLLATLLLVSDSSADKQRKRKKVRRTTSTEAPEADVISMIEQDEEEDKEKVKLDISEEAVITDNNVPITAVCPIHGTERFHINRYKPHVFIEVQSIYPRGRGAPLDVYLHFAAIDPCYEKHCGAGRVCKLTEEGDAQCICIPNCPHESDPRRSVCTNHNETWNSDCELYQMRCWCDEGLDGCKADELKHAHIEYYGKCRQMPKCSEEEMSDFPRRMRDWLYNIMRDLADRAELTPYYLKMEREAEVNLTRRWSNAAIWKWCDLDGHPPDRAVSRHELFPIRAPLMALEHCIAPFLDLCDANNDHRITLTEWAKCLELDEDDIEDRCEDVRGEESD